MRCETNETTWQYQSITFPTAPTSTACAVAVLSVVFCHADLGWPGGFVGVDVFFVISGYLIAGLILKDLGRGTFSLLDFWERRIRRIAPAL